MKLIFRTIVTLIVLMFSFLCYHAVYLYFLFPWKADKLYFSEPITDSDAIVFLAAGRDRYNYAIKLFKSGDAKMLFMPGEGVGTGYRSYIHRKNRENDIRSNYYEGGIVNTTYDEAIETKKFVEKRGLKKIILVTSGYHSYRSHWIFSKVMPGIDIISAPVNKNGDNWPPDKELFELEQYKFLGYYLQYGWRFY